MPQNHSVGGNWHGGHKDTCAKCGYLAPVPVEAKPKVVATKPKPVKKAKKKAVSNA